MGLAYPKEVFSHQARRSALHPRHGERFGYAHFYLCWAGLGIPFGIGMKLINDGRRRRMHRAKDYGRHGH